MTAITLPTTTSGPIATGDSHPHESGGRLINCRARKLSDTAGTKISISRVPGLTEFATATGKSKFRGAKQVGANLYSAWDGSMVRHDLSGAMTSLTGSLPGDKQCFFARNNKSTPDFVIVQPGEGAFVATTSAVSTYPDGDVGSPSSLCFHKGMFFFGYGNGQMRASNVNDTEINTTSVASAEYRPDTLYRLMSFKDTLIPFGSESIEFWGGINDTGFPVSFITAIDVGIVGPYAATGDDDGFGAGAFFVGSDFRVRKIVGYGSDPVSTPDIERMIARLSDKAAIKAFCYVTNGEPIVVIHSDEWTLEYNVSTDCWNERQSYGGLNWRGLMPTKAFGDWYCGLSNGNKLYRLDIDQHKEAGEPLRMRIETGPMGNFPQQMRVERVEIYATRGVGIAAGHDPDQTDPTLELSLSPDGGQTWKAPRQGKLGRQSVMTGRLAFNNLGIAFPQGARLRIDVSDAVPVGIMGGDMAVSVIR